ncbi:methionine--tRNA ligase subunit beta [Candidatus Pacearchaeota archaeon CG10_big_fil_rev_8_21_14_0_10_35_219]|nr:methionine--tRNA ligase subunit beta [Candidatus Pacearchaeota archaeon]OIO42682.1 MAG: methionine--tRNA ligase subunit beta [Candidatus Pacearchaeota archaeon CG1_02_35_32]PIO08294.1 MAG: methionine--tRNA ligase subunit beta [Candidatus Pacearchaeota archaeon CG10_big_fil_rev_8_21_14_0_10_35_219]PIY81895.1 MAG: methionine--tRNA ligase subunit beta [Candidatus Pacearchaeota archaeon CG_4_10_14_0_8_um_filter_35_169]PIZ79364.1 MAG: methionine--tRNA ligase subunit beta [Candidatus Pacearchaeota
MTEQIPFKDFQKLEMKVGTIEKVEDHPDADRLYVLTINLGNETRTIVAGLKQHYTKEELQGKQAIFITNLAPVTLRGIESQGMILAASNEDKVVILQPEKPMPEGSKIS